MGCSTSKVDDEEAVQLCKDRKKFVKQAVEYRIKFASWHIAYIQSMKRVSAALREYIDGDEPREFLLDSFTQPPVKRTSQGFIPISPTSFTVKPIKSEPDSTFKINYLRSGGNPAVAVEERPPQSPETVRIEAYSPVHQFGMDSIFAMQSSPMNSSSFFHYSPNNRPNFPPPSPQTSQWDFFWNPFSSLDYYGYPTRSNLDQTFLDDDNDELRQVREEEGIPELEEDSEQEEINDGENTKAKRDHKVDLEYDGDEVIVEDVDESEESDDCDSDDETDSGTEAKLHIQGLEPHKHQHVEVAKNQNIVQNNSKEAILTDCESKSEKPGYTVYVNRRPTSMAEVIKDLEDQFMMVCKSASEVSSMLEASRAQYLSTSNDLTAAKMINPMALFRSASSRSSSSRFLVKSSTSRDESNESNESNRDFCEESCMYSGSHQSTLDRLYAWEKKLYQEVRDGERIRIAYDKKCKQLKNQDVKGEDPSSLDKTRTAIRDLQTQMKVSIHSVEAVSKRIETLRDEELLPQLLELVQGLSRMWHAMAEGHQMQKRTLDEAKILLAGMPSKRSGTKKYTVMSPSLPHQQARSAAILEMELRNWRSCFESWIVSQRSYVQALTGWLLRCVHSDEDTSKLPFSPCRSLTSKLPFSPRRPLGAPPIFTTCIEWSRFLDTVRESPVLEGLDFFAAGVGSVYAQQLREDSRKNLGGSKRFGGEPVGGMEMVEVGHFEDEVMTAEKMSEVAIRVLCAGMSVAVSSLTQFSVSSAEGYADLVQPWNNTKQTQSSNGMGKLCR